MGLFSGKKNTAAVVPARAAEKPKKKTESRKPVLASVSSVAFDSHVLVRPRVTEKATELSKGGREVTVFEVSRTATKGTVGAAVRSLYKVTPEKVAIVRIPPKRKYVRGRMTESATRYKAYVYLKKGEKIEVV